MRTLTVSNVLTFVSGKSIVTGLVLLLATITLVVAAVVTLFPVEDVKVREMSAV